MRIDVLQHVACEGPAAIADWVEQRGHQVVVHQLYAGDPVPDAAALDFLVILGGPMSVNDCAPNWIAEERRCIHDALAGDTPVFGVCLGAQQIAKTLGADVVAGQKEVGWFPIRRVSSVLPFLPETMTPLHWHGETFELPEGAIHLFESKACVNQGFVYHDQAIGLQFHMEATKASVESLLIHDRDYIDDSPHVQTAEEIGAHAVAERNEQTLFALLDWLTCSN